MMVWFLFAQWVFSIYFRMVDNEGVGGCRHRQLERMLTHFKLKIPTASLDLTKPQADALEAPFTLD